ncbi:hypothetical protein ABBQ38_008609 [Trebouxia sp. C0009 RCD-2024]
MWSSILRTATVPSEGAVEPEPQFGAVEAQPAQSTVALSSQRPLYGPDHLSLGVWGWGQQPGHQLVVRQASQRLRLIQARKHGTLSVVISVSPRQQAGLEDRYFNDSP